MFQRWVKYYRMNVLQNAVHTNNGVEVQNRILKSYMRFRTDKSFSGLVTVVHKHYLPEALLKYVSLFNLRWFLPHVTATSEYGMDFDSMV